MRGTRPLPDTEMKSHSDCEFQRSGMVSRSNSLDFLNQMHRVRRLAFILMVTCQVKGVAVDLNFKGEVGGNVTIYCPSDKERTVKLFYLQRGEAYVNGFHRSYDISDTQTWENTRVDQQKTAVHMLDLNASHSGDYQCIIQYSDSRKHIETNVHLDVTATYSTPEVNVLYKDGQSCLVTCASHRGYPGSRVMWNVSGHQAWWEVNTSEIPDPDTMLVNSTSTAHFNCSKGEMFASCSVAGVTSKRISLCAPHDSPVLHNHYVIAAVVVAVAVAVAFIVAFARIRLVSMRNKRRAGNVVLCWDTEAGRQMDKLDLESKKLSTL